MRLLEYQGKEIFEKNGIPVGKGVVAHSPEEAIKAAETTGYPVVIKAQVLAGGRGKAGGVKIATNQKEVEEYSKKILGMSIKNEIAESVLIASVVDIDRELYAGITIDPVRGLPVLIFSLDGGMDIEEIANKHPERLLKMHLAPTKEYKTFEIMDFLRNSELESNLLPKVAKILLQLIKAFNKTDCTTAEINPLVITKEKEVIALDSKVVIDDSAIQRQKDCEYRENTSFTPLEIRAKKAKLNYVPLEGNIAVIAGGAGLAMYTMDLVSYYNQKPASFLDTGGGVTSENMAEALRISLSNPGVEGVIINVFGGINNCEVMAKGIAQVIDNDKPKASIVVKMRGHSQDEGWEILENRNIPLIKYGTSEEAMELLVKNLGGMD